MRKYEKHLKVWESKDKYDKFKKVWGSMWEFDLLLSSIIYFDKVLGSIKKYKEVWVSFNNNEIPYQQEYHQR